MNRLIATLGSRSTLKKVGRKDILKVDVPKACETVLDSEVPLALRLQGSLLFGLTRVYERKCAYLLADTESTRSLLLNVITRQITETRLGSSHVARREQITLQDDPNLMLDLELSSKHFDSGFDYDDSMFLARPGSRSSSMLPSQYMSQLENDFTNGPETDVGLVIPTSQSNDSYVPHHTDLGGDERSRQLESDQQLHDEDFRVDPDGSLEPISQRRIHDEERDMQVNIETQGPQAYDMDLMPMQDNDDLLPLRRSIDDAYAVPFAREEDSAAEPEEHIVSSTELLSAQAQQRPSRRARIIPRDQTMEIGSNVIQDWQTNYLQMMASARDAKEKHREPHLAKLNAKFLVVNNMLGMGTMFDNAAAPEPLKQFLGPALLSMLGLGEPAVDLPKRKHDEVTSVADEADRRVRPRISDDEAGRGEEELDLMEDEAGFSDLDNTLEQGRALGTPLADRRSASASLMPWIGSASQRASSTRRPLNLFSVGGVSSSAGTGQRQPYSRAVSLNVSPSPLLGRTGHVRADRDTEAQPDDQVNNLMAIDEFDTGVAPDQNEPDMDVHVDDRRTTNAEQLDPSQTTNISNRSRQTPDKDLMEFFDLVTNYVMDCRAKRQEQEQQGESPAPLEDEQCVKFEDLVKAGEHTNLQASQRFMHMLTLGTRGLLDIRAGAEFGQVMLRLL